MNYFKLVSRNFIFPALMYFSFDRIIRSLSNKNILFITYHGVVEKDGSYFSPRNIHKDQFEKQLIYYINNFDIKSTSEVFDMIINNKIPRRKTISISFDDGFKNNLYTVLPLLEKYQVPATFCVSSVCLEEMDIRCLWSEKIAALRYYHKDEVIVFGDYIFDNFFDKNINKYLEDVLKTIPHYERDMIIDYIVKKYDLIEKIQKLPEELWKLMTRDELIQLSKSALVEIGSHGHLHYNLSEIDYNKSKDELIISKLKLEKELGRPINILAYPDGSYNSKIKDLAEEVGYKCQLAVKYLDIEDENDIRIMNRHGVSSTTTYDSNIIRINYSFLK